jgi:hypothetical protein
MTDLPPDPESIRALILQILRESGCKPPNVPDGRALYGYLRWLTPSRLSCLERLLRTELRASGSVNRWVAAGFCLYAAHTFCQNHEDGNWKWATVTTCLNREDVPVSQLREYVLWGLLRWNRKVASPTGNRNLYLVTLGCEGGLPLRLLQKQSAALARYFRNVLRTCEDYGAAWSPRQAAEHFALELLPRSLRLQTVYELTDALISMVIELRHHLRTLGRVKDEIAALDAQGPEWRNRLPLRLEDDVARGLLKGLLAQPRASAVREAVLLRIETRLDFPTGFGNPAEVERVIGLRPTVPREALPGEADLPPMLRLSLDCSGSLVRRLAFATLVGSSQYRIERTGEPVFRDPKEICSALTVVAHSGGRELGREAVRGGEALDASVPWVFALRHGRWRICGAGSCSLADDEVLVSLPADGPEPTLAAGGELEELGGIPRLNRRLWRLRGQATVNADDDAYTVSTGVAGAGELRFALFSGPQAVTTVGPNGSEIYLRKPSIQAETHDGKSVHATLSWKPCGSSRAWEERLPPLGNVVIRGRYQGKTVFRGSAVVLPKDFRWTLRPGPRANEGSVELTNLPVRGATLVDTPDGVEIQVDAQARRVILRCSPVATPPSYIQLRLMLEGGYEARLRVSSPVATQRFLGPGRIPLPQRVQITLEQLGGTVAQAVISGKPRDGRFLLKARGSHPRSNTELLARLDCNPISGVYELPLHGFADEIEALLAQSDRLDACARLYLDDDDDPERRIELQVGRFDASFDVLPGEPHDRILVLDATSQTLLGGRAGELRVQAEQLWNPEQPRTDLPCVFDEQGRAQWRIDLASLGQPGAWLVTGWEGDHARLRPLLVTLGDQNEFPRRNEFESAVHATGDLNREITGFLGSLASQGPRHPDWPRVFELLRRSRDLPISTYKIVQRMPSQPNALALAALLDSATMAALWSRFERQPFLWEFVPLACWAAAAKAMNALYAELNLDQRASESLNPLLRDCGNNSPYLHLVAWALREIEPRPDDEGAAASELSMGIRALLESADPERTLRLATNRFHESMRIHLRRVVGHVPNIALRDLSRALTEAGVPDRLQRNVYDLRVQVPHGPRQTGLVNAPLFTAAATLFGTRLPRSQTLAVVRRAVAFDESWFRAAHREAAILLIGYARRHMRYLP